MSTRSAQYYAANRERILAANRRCAQRRGRLWKRSNKRCPSLERKRVLCADCGIELYAGDAVRFPFRVGRPVKFYRCPDCESEIGRDSTPSYRNAKCAMEALHLFRYASELVSKADSAECSFDDEALAILERHIGTLPPRLKQVLVLRVFEQRTLQDAGNKLGVTRERIRQMVLKAIRVLGNTIKREQHWRVLFDIDPDSHITRFMAKVGGLSPEAVVAAMFPMNRKKKRKKRVRGMTPAQAAQFRHCRDIESRLRDYA